MSTIVLRGMGLERIQAEVTMVLASGLGAELDRMSQQLSGWDHFVATQLGNSELAPFHLEHPVTYFPGHRRSMIDQPKESYPIVTVLAYNFRRDPERDGDQYDAGIVSTYVEGIVKGATEGIVNRAVQRTAEACHNVLKDSLNVNGCVSEVPVPGATIYDEVDRPVGTDPDGGFADGSGDVWWWQAFRLNYEFPTVHTLHGVNTPPAPQEGVSQDTLVGSWQ